MGNSIVRKVTFVNKQAPYLGENQHLRRGVLLSLAE